MASAQGGSEDAQAALTNVHQDGAVFAAVLPRLSVYRLAAVEQVRSDRILFG